MSGEEKHLTIEQIERLLEFSPGAQEIPRDHDLPAGVRSHLENCDACQHLVSMEKKHQNVLRRLRPEFSTTASGECPTETRVYELVAGLLDDKDSELVMRHVTDCDHCGPVLRNATEQLNGSQKDDAEVLGSLETSRPEWQEQFGKRLAGSIGENANPAEISRRPKVNTPFKWQLPKLVWAIAALAFVVLFVFSIAVGRRGRASYAEELLATAYSERRTLDFRIPGAMHAPLQINRGQQNSNFDKPTALLEAEHLIANQLRSSSSDPKWLRAKVRADLLDGNYRSAISTAEKALLLEPNSPSLLNDLGTGYFERAENEGRTADYGLAYDTLSKSLAQNPDDVVALFNRAIVAEREHLYAQAENDWNHFLQTEKDQEWQAEGRQRLSQVEEIIRKHKDHSESRLQDPEAVAEALSSGDPKRIDSIDSEADEYLKVALEEWLPQLVADRVLDRGRPTSLEKATELLADDLRENHADFWLSEFHSGRSPSTDESHAIDLLVSAIHANAKGDYETAIHFAENAAVYFQKLGNEAGRARAAYESVYSNRLAARGQECYDQAKSVIKASHRRNYVWIEVQARLELAACAVELSKVDQSVSGSEQALELAKSSKYRNLILRATMFSADLSRDPNSRFRLIDEGLVAFWAGRYDPMRGYSLYAVMDTSADDLHLWFWDKAAIREGLLQIEADPELATLRGIEMFRLARADLAVGELDEAQRVSREASELLKKNDSPTLVAGASIDLAEAFVIKGHYDEALTLLVSVEPLVSELSQDIVLGQFHSTRAAALLGAGRNAEAERSLALAMEIAKRGLTSIAEERDRYSWLKSFESVYRSLAYVEFRSDTATSFRSWESFKAGSLHKIARSEGDKETLQLLQSSMPVFESWSKDRTVFLSYVTFTDGIAIWAYDGKEVHGRWLPGSTTKIDSLAARFHEDCADRYSDPDALLLEGRALYDLLIEPTKEWSNGRELLIIETDSSLQSIPFEALVDKQGKYLSDSYEIEYSPGVLYLAQDPGSEQISRASRALVIGQSEADPLDGLPPLPGARDEAHQVAARFNESVILLDDQATFNRVIEELPRAAIFHFAGHAITNRQVSGLLLSGGSFNKRILDVTNFNSHVLAHNRLLVLSACSTANGIGSGMNDRESLARNALAAGVPNVIASRWLVDSLAASEWMRVFYQVAVGGESVSAAAKQARLSLRANPQWRHPFYWATFSVFV